eukprot:2275151-Prymnesium_polylepis.1
MIEKSFDRTPVGSSSVDAGMWNLTKCALRPFASAAVMIRRPTSFVDAKRPEFFQAMPLDF